MKTWLKQDIYWPGREWVYKDLPRRIVAEKYLEDESGELCDYKFFCFNGKPVFMKYYSGRFTEHPFRNYYDMNMNYMAVSDEWVSNPNASLPLEKFEFNRMKEVAEDLASSFQQVRVDFYYNNGKIYFGELTFFHRGGFQRFNPEIYDKIIGDYWKISK